MEADYLWKIYRTTAVVGTGETPGPRGITAAGDRRPRRIPAPCLNPSIGISIKTPSASSRLMEVRERIETPNPRQERLFDRLGAAELHGDIEHLIGGFSPAGKQLPKRVQSAGARLAGNKPFGL